MSEAPFKMYIILGRTPLTIEALSPLTVSSGRKSLDPTQPDIPQIRNIDGTPTIPGSTLKGFIRGQIHRLLNTIDPVKAQRIVTALFGNAGRGERETWGSRILLEDATPAGDVKILSREHVRIDPRTMGAAPGGLFTQEYVPEGARFIGGLYFRNLPPSLLALLKYVSEMAEVGIARIGRSKSRGYGKVRITPGTTSIKLIAPQIGEPTRPIKILGNQVSFKITQRENEYILTEKWPGNNTIEFKAEVSQEDLWFKVGIPWQEISGKSDAVAQIVRSQLLR